MTLGTRIIIALLGAVIGLLGLGLRFLVVWQKRSDRNYDSLKTDMQKLNTKLDTSVANINSDMKELKADTKKACKS